MPIIGDNKISLTIGKLPILRGTTLQMINKSKMRKFVSHQIAKTNQSINVRDVLPKHALLIVQRHTSKRIVKIYAPNKSRLLKRNSKVKKNVGRVSLRST